MLWVNPLFGILSVWSNWVSPTIAQQTFFPSAVPLAVRTSTFNAWLDTRNGSNPMIKWPSFWNDQHNFGWVGYIKVDNLTYRWLGGTSPGIASALLATEITPTRTILTVRAGPILLNVTFLSPVEPANWTRQSFPFSYVSLNGKATDGQSHSVQLYSDITAEWVTNSEIDQTNLDIRDVAEDSVAYYAISNAQPKPVSVVGTDTLRYQFAAPGEGFDLIPDLTVQNGTVQLGNKSWPVFAHALDLGTTETVSTVVWALGVTRDPVVTFMGNQQKAYYWSQYITIGDGIDAFMDDFPDAQARAIQLDQQLLRDATAVSQDYVDLVSLATRQAMAGVEITLSTGQDGSLNTSDVKAFMKDVGNSQRVNPIEVIYAALPAFMYLNASITGALLKPLLEYQDSPAYTNSYAAPDLGSTYPAVPGNPQNNAPYGVENSGNMLILVLAHARSSGDGSLIGKYYNLLKQWADYLATNALIPEHQKPADARDTDLAQARGNVTNLALKGIIGIQAMSEISRIMDETEDAQKYETSANSLMQSWVSLTATASGQLKWTYDDDTTWGLMYNLLADKLLQLNIVPASIYSDQSTIISNNAAQVPAFGFPLSSDSNSNTRSDWTLFSAAAAPDPATRNRLISLVRKHASSNLTGGPFPTLYNVQTGVSPNGSASPAQGAIFSVLALNVTNKTVVVPPSAAPPASDSRGSKKKSKTGTILGSTFGALAFLLLVVGGVAMFVHRWRQHRDANIELKAPRPYQALLATSGNKSKVDISSSSDSPAVPPSRAAAAAASPKIALMNGSRHAPQSVSPAPSQPASSPQPSSSGEGPSVSRGNEELRFEMERLRHEVEQLRVSHEALHEAPLGYH
ncbi:hypothetical protein B0H13DRAFT_2658900 [Mycena leptocephala]|nr:hypothetical protein B0H13DRAFT_2658900 [Mycena leptocephala]